jgi:hypothetical protein
MTEDYTTKLDTLNAKLSETGKKYGENSDQANALRGQIEQLGESHASAMDTMALKTLQAKDATDQMQLDFALASGVISQKGYDQAVMMDRLASAYVGGQLNAQQYATAVGNVAQMVAGLNGASASAYIDVYIRVHGEMPSGMSAGIAGPRPKAVADGYTNVFQGGKAIGGPVQSGSMYEVSENGAPELLTVGGKSFLMMGNKSGYVSPGANGNGGGQSNVQMEMLVSRIPSASENAKALARELMKVWS